MVIETKKIRDEARNRYINSDNELDTIFYNSVIRLTHAIDNHTRKYTS